MWPSIYLHPISLPVQFHFQGVKRIFLVDISTLIRMFKKYKQHQWLSPIIPNVQQMIWILSLQNMTKASTGKVITLPSMPQHKSSHKNCIILLFAHPSQQISCLLFVHTPFLHYKTNRNIEQCASKMKVASLNSYCKIYYIKYKHIL